MIHLAGYSTKRKVKRALEEIAIFEGEGIHGIIVEDYHGTAKDVEGMLGVIAERGTSLVVGINVLSNPYSGFSFADKYGAKFIQFDSVQSPHLDSIGYAWLRKKFPNVVVLGGVGFKYIKSTGKSLEEDLSDVKDMCEAIVTTGEGTGIETPTEKLREFRKVMDSIGMNHLPLIVGAGVNDQNAREQLGICGGAIVGSFFKGGSTRRKVNLENVRKLMTIVEGYL